MKLMDYEQPGNLYSSFLQAWSKMNVLHWANALSLSVPYGNSRYNIAEKCYNRQPEIVCFCTFLHSLFMHKGVASVALSKAHALIQSNHRSAFMLQQEHT